MNIGTHIHKSGSFIRSLRAFYETKPENLTKPVQLFSGSPKWWRRPGVTLTDYNETNPAKWILEKLLIICTII